eukprot:198767-Chlamydomonas_euryale.AAC.1
MAWACPNGRGCRFTWHVGPRAPPRPCVHSPARISESKERGRPACSPGAPRGKHTDMPPSVGNLQPFSPEPMRCTLRGMQDACLSVVAESYRLWLANDTRTDDITMIVVQFHGLVEEEQHMALTVPIGWVRSEGAEWEHAVASR